MQRRIRDIQRNIQNHLSPRRDKEVYRGLATSETLTNEQTEPDYEYARLQEHFFVPRQTDWASEKKGGDFRKSPYL